MMPYTVATVVIVMFEIVLPTNTAVISLSKSSHSNSACAALLLSSAARFFSLILLADENAVSVAEKNVEQSVSIIIATKYPFTVFYLISQSIVVSISGASKLSLS